MICRSATSSENKPHAGAAGRGGQDAKGNTMAGTAVRSRRPARVIRYQNKGCRSAMQPHFKTASAHRGTHELFRLVNPVAQKQLFSAD